MRGARDQHQLRPPPPSGPSPPAEPDFTPPAVRAGRNSHFAAADPAPTTAAACVTSRRRAAGPAPPQRPGSRARGGGAQPPSSCSASCSWVIGPPATHRPPSALSCLPPPRRVRTRPRLGGGAFHLSLNLGSSAPRVWGGLSLRGRRESGPATSETHSTPRSRSAQP